MAALPGRVVDASPEVPVEVEFHGAFDNWLPASGVQTIKKGIF